MPVNPNIILGIQPAKFQVADPLESASKSLALQGLMGQQDLQGMQLRQAKQAEADDLATRDAFKAGGDQKAIIDRLMGAGQYKPAQALQKAQLDQRKGLADINKTELEGAAKRAEIYRNVLSGVRDDASYQAALQNPIVAAELKDRGGAPATFDPNWQRTQVLTADKFLDAVKPHITMVQDGGVTRAVDTNAFSNPGITQRTFSTADPGKDLVLPGADGVYRPNAPLVDTKKQVAAAGASKTVVNMADGQKGFDNELKLRGDFRQEPVYKAHQEMTSAHQQITSALKQGTPVGDLAGATKIMKLLDPGSVVRESELGMAMAASGLMDRLSNYANMVTSGQKLTPTQRADFKKLGDALFTESVTQYNKKRGEYTGIASQYGLNGERVTGAEVRAPTPLAPAATADPRAVDAALKKYLPGNR